MEKIHSQQERFSQSTNLAKIIQKLNYIFSIFKKRFSYELKNFGVNEDDTIEDVQRGLINEHNQIFRNYLGATHNTMQELPIINKGMNHKNSYHCTKLILSSGKSIIFSINPIPHNLGNILCLDKFFLGLNKYERKEFDKTFLGINKIESDYFHSKLYTESLSKIKAMSSHELSQILNIEKSNN